MTRVRLLNKYLTPDGDRVFSYVRFCGACGLEIGSTGHAYCGRPGTPDDLIRSNEADRTDWSHEDSKPFRFYAYCPWCGAKFDDEWWKDQAAENERPADHYSDPGHHKGDSHVFTGDSPQDAIAGHYLATTGDEVCWCEPEVVPSLLGCEIRHRAGARRDR